MAEGMTKWKARALRATAAAKRVKEVSAKTTEASMGTVIAAVGGASAGLMNSKWPTIRSQNTVTVATLAGAGLSLLGVTGLGGAASAQALDLGQGILSGDIAIKTFLAAEKRRQTVNRKTSTTRV